MDGDEPAAGAERARQRPDDALGLEVERGARAIGLRGDDEIVIGERAAGPRNDRVEQEAVIFAIDHQHHRAVIDRVAGARADAGFPVLGEEWFERHDLFLEAVRRIAGQRQLVPDHARCGVERLHREPRRVRIGEVGQHQHRRRMLEEAVRHFLQRQADVFEADFLADGIERHVREAVVHGAHHPHQHRAVADAGVEHAHRRRPRMQMREFFGDAVRDLPFLAAGVDEQQIFLPVVEEAEIALRIVRPRRRRGWQRRRHRRAGSRARSMIAGRWPCRGMRRHEAVDAVERVGGDAAAVAQPRGELAVIDGAAAEGRFRKPGLAAIVRNFLKELLRVHGVTRLPDVSSFPRVAVRAYDRAVRLGNQAPWAKVNHKSAHYDSGQNDGLYPIKSGQAANEGVSALGQERTCACDADVCTVRARQDSG